MADTADLDYIHLVQRLGATVGDTPDDVDLDPDFVPVTEGTITIVPTTPESRVLVNGAPVSIMNAPIVCTVDSQGYLSYGGSRGVWIVDLGSAKVTPPVPRDKAAYTITYSGLKFGTQTFKKSPVSINPDSAALAGADFNLTDATSLPLPSGVTLAYIQGIADEAVAAVASITGQKGVAGGFAALDVTTGDVLDAEGNRIKGNTQYVSRGATDALSGVRRMLDVGARSFALQVMSDSTANDATDWPHLLAQNIAADYPDWTVRWQSWDDANGRFPAPTIIQTGTAGPLYLDGSTGTNALELDSSISPRITGSLDVRVKLRLASWDVTQVLVAKSGGSGKRGWLFSMNSEGAGRPYFTYSTDGVTLINAGCTATPPQVAGTDTWLRVVYVGNDGAGNTVVTFYTSDDGIAWTQLGAAVTTVGTTTLFDNSDSPARLGGNTTALAGSRFYEVEVRDGIDGPNKVPALPDLWRPIATPAANAHTVGAPVITVINGGKAGGDIAYLTDPTRLPKLVPNFGQQVTFLSQSHNMGVQFGEQWSTTYKAFADAVRGALNVPMVALSQNPEKGAAVNKEWHAQRARELPGIAHRYGLGFIDTFQMFVDDPDYLTQKMADDVHPNVVGSQEWADLIWSAIRAAE